jgi:hypothetical protein
MSNIQSLLDLIRSDNHSDRYDACEQLRVWPEPLSQEAIIALNVATKDSNADVADAARRALSFHTSIPSEKQQEAAEKAVIYIEDGIIERQHDTGIINISYPRRDIWSSLAAYAAIVVAASVFVVAFAVTDVRFLLLFVVPAYFVYLIYRKFLGFQKSAIKIDPQTEIVRIKGKQEEQVLFGNIDTVSVEPGEGIVLAGMARANIVLTLKSGKRIIVASLSEDAVRVANKVEEISAMLADTIGLMHEKEEQNSE